MKFNTEALPDVDELIFADELEEDTAPAPRG